MTSTVWHHRHPGVVGQEVRDIYDEPGIGGWMPFLKPRAVLRQNDEGEWELQPITMARKIHEFIDPIRSSGFLMLDSEGPLDDHNNTSLYIEALTNARMFLYDLGIYDTKLGIFRIPDHVRDKEERRFDFMPVLRHTDAVFVMIKSSSDKWTKYAEDVRQVAPEHAHVVYMDAETRPPRGHVGPFTPVPFTRDRIIATVRLAHGWLTNPQIGFRQSGPNVAQAMLWVAEWLGY